MQHNHPVIISIPQSQPKSFPTLDPFPVSPLKNSTYPSSLKDDISWKKSLSAFKKFKCKKQKDSKTPKHSQTNLSSLQPEPSNPLLNTNFSLVDNDIKFSLLTNQDNQLILFQDHFHYFDPNAAPFFEFGVTYNFPEHANNQKVEETQEPLKLGKKQSITPRLRKEHSKKDKSKLENQDPQNIVKRQKSHSQQDLPQTENQPGCDPFIIIKAAQLRPKEAAQIQQKQEQKDSQKPKKTKSIRKKTKYVNVSEAIYSRDSFSRQKSSEYNQNEDFSESHSIGYGKDELPIIEFDFGMTIAPKVTEGQSGFDNLPIYETKESSQVRARMRPFIHTNEILKDAKKMLNLMPRVNGKEKPRRFFKKDRNE